MRNEKMKKNEKNEYVLIILLRIRFWTGLNIRCTGTLRRLIETKHKLYCPLQRVQNSL